MDMITVLNTIPAVVGNNNGEFCFWGFVLGIVSVIILLIAADNNRIKTFIVSSIIAILCAVSFIYGLITAQTSSPEKYQCTINEGADAKKFAETFVIDKQEGLIYTVYMKTNEK